MKLNHISKASLSLTMGLILLTSMLFSQILNWKKTAKEKAIDALFERWNNPESTGLTISIMHKGRIAYQQGYGRKIVDIYLKDYQIEEPKESQEENPKTAKQAIQKPTNLSAYEGRYYSEELDTYYHFSVKGDQLIALHQRIPDIVFFPLAEDSFHCRTWFFKTVQFERDKSGKVTGFKVSNRGVSNLRFHKVSKELE